jgi:hypothetical protein
MVAGSAGGLEVAEFGFDLLRRDVRFGSFGTDAFCTSRKWFESGRYR